MNEKIMLEIVFDNKFIDVKIFQQFHELNLFSYEKIRHRQYRKTKELKYTSEKFIELLNKSIETNDEFMLEISQPLHQFRVIRKEAHSFFSITFPSEIFFEKKNDIFFYINNIFNNSTAIVAYIVCSEDNFWQNMEQTDIYKAFNKPFDYLKLIKSPMFENERIIDIEQNAGHSHIVDDLWFGSCWAMWFGKRYYEYIPESLIASFKDGFENMQLDSGARRVLLYEDISSFDKLENREIQQKFRYVTGMDVVAHELMNKPPDNVDPTIEILNGQFEHGGTKIMKRYLDKENEMIEKSKAVRVEIREFEVIDNRWKTVSNKVVDI